MLLFSPPSPPATATRSLNNLDFYPPIFAARAQTCSRDQSFFSIFSNFSSNACNFSATTNSPDLERHSPILSNLSLANQRSLWKLSIYFLILVLRCVLIERNTSQFHKEFLNFNLTDRFYDVLARATPFDRKTRTERNSKSEREGEREIMREPLWPIGQKSCTKNQFCKTAPATSLSELEHTVSSLCNHLGTKRETGFVHARLLGILTSSSLSSSPYHPAVHRSLLFDAPRQRFPGRRRNTTIKFQRTPRADILARFNETRVTSWKHAGSRAVCLMRFFLLSLFLHKGEF